MIQRVKKVKIKDYTGKCPNYFYKRYSKSKDCYFYPDIIVLHNTGGYNISSAHYWFLNEESQTSAHYLIGLDGEVRQYVRLTDGSYCNGTSSNPNSKAFYKTATNEIVKEREYNANFYTVSIEFVGDVGDRLTVQQLTAAVDLIEYINTQLEKLYGVTIPYDRKHIIGHYEINPKSRATCGVNIQFDEILKRLNKEPEKNELSEKVGQLEESKEVEESEKVEQIEKPNLKPKPNLLNNKERYQNLFIKKLIKRIKK